MSLDELQDCNWVARGCVRRSVFVLFSYAFIAATKMLRKLEEDVEVVWDIMTAPLAVFQIGSAVDERDAARPSKGRNGLPLGRLYGETLIRSVGDDWR